MSAPHGDGQQLVEQLGLFCQRWTRRRVSYRPAGEIFDPRFVSVEPIEESAAKAFVEAHHYSASYPAARFRAGVVVKAPFREEVLAGVGVFSVSMNQQVVPAYFDGFAPSEGIELGRFVLADSLAANAESYCLARMHRLLKAALPAVRGVLAYCDPVERRDETGQVVSAATSAPSTRRRTPPTAASQALAHSGSRPEARASRIGCSQRCGCRRLASATR